MPTVQARLSTVNWTFLQSTITATTEAAGWPASNLRYPQQPFMEWRSTSLSIPQALIVDFGTARLIELVILVNVNFLAPGLTLVFEDTAGGGQGPSITVSPAFNLWNRRHGFACLPVGANRRYLRLQIGTTQPTTDGATYFRCGGIWAGPFQAMPRDLRWDEEMMTIEPLIDLQPSHGAWRQRLKMGDPATTIRARRLAVTAAGAAPGINAELDQWLLADHYMWFYDAFAWYSNRGNAAEAWIMRRVSETAWPIHQTVSEGDLVMEEVTGP